MVWGRAWAGKQRRALVVLRDDGRFRRQPGDRP
ncbi:hypothetical protein SFR_2937 [Streptomyces sp. FR-008]|nr:hypothetical protein SFR_2937 [Streptomyces sp. FR-008]